MSPCEVLRETVSHRKSALSGDIAGQYLGYVVGRQLAFRNLSTSEAGALLPVTIQVTPRGTAAAGGLRSGKR